MSVSSQVNWSTVGKNKWTSNPFVVAPVVAVVFLLATLSSRYFVVKPVILAPVWTSTAILMFALLKV